jgi:peptidoglycan/xylan/chitin deacetylase (PgdA/CDA1 family)
MTMSTPPESEHWNVLFASEDPWSYGDTYEQTKRAHTLEILESRKYNRVLEIGCGEGWLSEALAPLAEQLIAIDISNIALERARRRCAAHERVTFEQMNAFRTLPAGPFDLIVCAEFLYYAQDRFALANMTKRLASLLCPHGHLVVTHANCVSDCRSRPGLDIHEFGAAFIGRTLQRIRNLRLAREIRTEIYSVQLFTRVSTGAIASRARVSTRHAEISPSDRVARLIKWNGCTVTAGEARQLWRSIEIPILMYHRIAENGPAELAPYRVTPSEFARQLMYLQQQGYHTVTVPEAWRQVRESARGAPGKAIAITFDDGYQDFADVALPLLHKNGFFATILVPVSLVGRRAEWDASLGEAAPIMSWQTIRQMRREGMHIGSHGLQHLRLTQLPEPDVHTEVRLSKQILENEVGTAVDTFSYPFGEVNEMVAEATRGAGYACAVVGQGRVDRHARAHFIPRQEVLGTTTMREFVDLLGTSRPSPLTTRIRYRWRRLRRDRRTYMDW